MDKEFVNNGLDTGGQYTYYAFISYQRKDEKWAKWLQRKLENYKLPVANAKDASDKKSKYIRPVFRDKTDLTAGPLPDALKEALQQSRYLIVICSPNAVESPWVNEEIETFTKAGRTEFVIPFIVDGEPYSKNGAKECFPDAIKAIPKDKEPLGVNINESGKERAFIRTVAYMLNVKFDELWNRLERHRRKIRNITIACLAFLALIALGIYDYTRTKVEYFADWVDCNGVAQGVIPLNDEQVSHRYASYRFEYTRVPFGEKGFYSWRLNRVSLVNSKGVISTSVPDNHAFFYPIQEYKYTDGYVTEIINRDTYNRVVMRYTIKDDYDHKVACLVDMEGKEKHQGSAYLGSSTTAFISDATQNMSKIKRFHYTRNEKGYITKVTYHANDADELDESAIGDNNNIYGKLFDLDEFGRVTKVTYINHEGNPMTDKYGVGYIRYNNAPFEGNDTIEYLGSDDKLTFNEHKFARMVSKLDKYGNPIEQLFEGADGEPCYDYKNRYRQVITFDENGFMIELKEYDFDGKLCYDSDNMAIQRAKYDSKGRWIEVSHYDVNDKPCYIKGGYCISKAKYNSQDCIIEQSVYDIEGKPCVENICGSHIMRSKYDEYNYLRGVSFLNPQEDLMLSPVSHVASQEIEYDDYHQPILVKNYDEKGNLCFDKDYVSVLNYSYDKRGNLTKIECIDTEGRPCICKEGYATITYKYDNYGNKLEETYFGIDGEPIYINMCTSIQYDYYPNGLVKEERYYDEKGDLCLNNNWYAISRYNYDNNGNQTVVCFFDVDNIPCYYKNGLYSRLESEYDGNCNVVKETYYDSKGNISLNSNGLYAIARYKYDNSRNVIEYAYFDDNDGPCFYYQEYHKVCVQFDKRRNVKQYSYYNPQGLPCKSKSGSEIVKYTYDDKNNITRIDFTNSKGNNIDLGTLGYSSEIRKYDDKNRLVVVSFLDKDNKPCWKNENPLNFCMIRQVFDVFGNIVEYLYYDTQGKLTNASGAARIIVNYDMKNRMISRRYYDKLGHLTPGPKLQKAIEIYDYNDYNQINKICLLNSDSTFFVNHYYLYDAKGRIISSENRDESGNLKVVHVPYFGRVPYAIEKAVWDDFGNLLILSYYDDAGKMMNTEDGYSMEQYTYDKYGKLLTDELFDELGNKTHSKVQGWHKSSGKYNDKGLIEEISYYDEQGKYVNVYTNNANGGCKIRYIYDDKGFVSNSILYEIKNGMLKEVQNSTTNYGATEIKRKADGSLVLGVVQMPGHFKEKGLNGNYFMVELNGWCIYDDLNKFGETLMTNAETERHFLLVPWEEISGSYNLGEIIFMEKINLEIEKYTFVYDNEDNYFIYVIPSQENKDFTDFYIQKEDYDFISFCIGLDMKKINCSNQEFINDNIMDWIDNYEDDIEALEDEKILNK